MPRHFAHGFEHAPVLDVARPQLIVNHLFPYASCLCFRSGFRLF
jgi:hypothetical protein